jgi:hypothetical protein
VFGKPRVEKGVDAVLPGLLEHGGPVEGRQIYVRRPFVNGATEQAEKINVLGRYRQSVCH